MAEVRMPKLGESVTEGTIGRWLKAVGERVEKYEPLAEVVTDKVTAELPSDFAGTLTDIVVAEGETVAVGVVLAHIAQDGAQAAASSEASTGSAPAAAERLAAEQGASARVPVSAAATAPDAPLLVSTAATTSDAPAAGRCSPAVLRLSSELGVNLADVTGTGIGGRITRKDVQAAAKQGSAQDTSATEGVQAAAQTAVVGAAQQGEEWLPLTPVRRMIAAKMLQSVHDAPHAWMMVEVDATALVRIRGQEKGRFREREGIDLTYLPFFLKAVADALHQFPMLNAVWGEDKIILKRDVHLSIAVAAGEALAVPVIHHADRLSIAGLAHAVADLATRARAGKLTMADVQGGTFTVNNTGAFGSILSQPIINAPQAAILSVESIVKRMTVQPDDSIAIRSMVNLCLSLDHRVLDGWIAGQFMKAVKERIESAADWARLS
jgi:2-oxoisovalerate dehydrogenase E2 component (dihydrolipoyl transacylase)